MTGLDSTSQCFEGIGICSFVSDPFEGINNFIYIYLLLVHFVVVVVIVVFFCSLSD